MTAKQTRIAQQRKKKSTSAISNADVARVFAGYPAAVRLRLMEMRELILQTAKSTDGVGALQETLKWGEPSYLTSQTKSGSTIRVVGQFHP